MADRGNRGNTFVWEGDYTHQKSMQWQFISWTFYQKKGSS